MRLSTKTLLFALVLGATLFLWTADAAKTPRIRATIDDIENNNRRLRGKKDSSTPPPTSPPTSPPTDPSPPGDRTDGPPAQETTECSLDIGFPTNFIPALSPNQVNIISAEATVASFETISNQPVHATASGHVQGMQGTNQVFLNIVVGTDNPCSGTFALSGMISPNTSTPQSLTTLPVGESRLQGPATITSSGGVTRIQVDSSPV